MTIGKSTPAFSLDPRLFQIAALSGLLFFGLTQRAFEIELSHAAAILVAACTAQWLGSMMVASPLDLKSPVITSLSLILLLRADAMWPLAIAAAIAVGSKFTLRLGGKHIFNPANIGIVSMVLLTGAAWTTPGQWGTAVWFAALLAGAGLFVTQRAARIDVPLIFLGVFAALLFIRALWLGDPLAIPLHRLQNGALILFAFFMISDPKTTPDHPVARVLFVAATATAAFIMTFQFHLADGLFFSLAAMCLLRPLFDWLAPAQLYQWGDAPPSLPRIMNPIASSTPIQNHHPGRLT
ncbi:MAG: RnfABCDGE type electron transport complex subunit D [Pseudomonadota bacterium]